MKKPLFTVYFVGVVASVGKSISDQVTSEIDEKKRDLTFNECSDVVAKGYLYGIIRGIYWPFTALAFTSMKIRSWKE